MLWYLIVGIIAGWLAGMISRGSGFGLVGNLITGVVGAMVGGFIFNLLGINAYGTVGSIVMSTVGAVVLLWIVRAFTGSRNTAK